MPTKLQLEEEIGELSRSKNDILRALELYRNYITRKLYNRKDFSKSHRKRGHYPFIPSGSCEVLSWLEGTAKYLNERDGNEPNAGLWRYRFLDCGCGIGNIVMFASIMGFNSTGIEYDFRTIAIARELLDGRGTIIKGDITAFHNYAKYDVIYYYQPMTDHGLMDKFQQKLIKDLKVGAIILPNGITKPIRESGKFKKILTGDHYYAYEKVSK